ncbi:MAG: M20 family peptidase [Coriobacteriia bacterium]|nr:M20 family peptidase [Coriobacteriia bacterium]
MQIWWILLGAFGVIGAFALILLARGLAFQPPTFAAPAIQEAVVDAERATASLAAMVSCKTVSSKDESLVDETEFERFRALLGSLYPHVYQACSLERVGLTGLLYHLPGESAAEPVVLMSHYDVVPAEDDAWEKPPFGGIVEDGFIWGRGTLDTKSTLCGVLEAAEQLLGQGFIPKNDLYFAFSGDEEIGGPSAPDIVDRLEQRGIRPVMVVDEGGAVVEGIFPGVGQPCALVGIAEKGYLDIELSIETQGGHASAPLPITSIGQLAQAVVRIESHPFANRLSPAVAEMFDTLGRHSNLLYRVIFANLWCFKPLLDSICRKTGGELNAMMRTTCAFTMMEGSNAYNVLPPLAKMSANLRLMGGETPESAIEYLKSVVDNPRIKYEIIYGVNPSVVSRTDGQPWQLLKDTIQQTWPEALVSPYLMVAASDSRHFCRISEGVYRFSAMVLSRAERESIHAHNERIPIKTLERIVQFYVRLMRQC